MSDDRHCVGDALPTVESVEDARRWIHIHHRYAIADIEYINELRDRIHNLERPWWQKLLRGRRI